MARGHFAKSKSQAASIMKEIQGTVIPSVGTVRNYEQALKTCCDYMKEHKARCAPGHYARSGKILP